MNKKTTDILAYITWIGWLVAFFAGDKENCKVHLNQGLVIFLVGFANSIVYTVLKSVPGIGILNSVVSVACFILMIMGIVAAAKGEDKELPIIGSIKILK